MRTDSNTVPPSIASTSIASTSISSQDDSAYSEAETDSDFDTDDNVSDNNDERKMNIGGKEITRNIANNYIYLYLLMN